MASERQLKVRIKKLKESIVELGLMHPGSLSEQYNVCGSANCKCKDERNPVKHGPYTNLSYTFKGKGGTKFVRKDLVRDFNTFTKNYGNFRKYVDELIQCNIDLIKIRSKKE